MERRRRKHCEPLNKQKLENLIEKGIDRPTNLEIKHYGTKGLFTQIGIINLCSVVTLCYYS